MTLHLMTEPADAPNPAAWLSRLRAGAWPARRRDLTTVRSLDQARVRRQSVRLRSQADGQAAEQARADRRRRALARAAARPADLPRPGMRLLSG